jgi:hypothetical protein
MVKLANTTDLKSVGCITLAGSIPAPGTNYYLILMLVGELGMRTKVKLKGGEDLGLSPPTLDALSTNVC